MEIGGFLTSRAQQWSLRCANGFVLLVFPGLLLGVMDQARWVGRWRDAGVHAGPTGLTVRVDGLGRENVIQWNSRDSIVPRYWGWLVLMVWADWRLLAFLCIFFLIREI